MAAAIFNQMCVIESCGEILGSYRWILRVKLQTHLIAEKMEITCLSFILQTYQIYLLIKSIKQYDVWYVVKRLRDYQLPFTTFTLLPLASEIGI